MSATVQKPLVSFLFVPGNRPERFHKALASGAHAIIIDLEDTVADADKSSARAHVLAFDAEMDAMSGVKVWLRINKHPSDDSLQAEDLATVRACQHLSGIVLPKVGSRAEIEHIAQFSQKPVMAIIETPAALLDIADIAKAKGLYCLSFGLLDLGNHLGVIQGSEGAAKIFDRVRYDLVLHSAMNALQPPIETIYADFRDDLGLTKAANKAYEMGFGGQLCIHPHQVMCVNTAFSLKENALGFAAKVLAEYERTGKSAFAIDGVMVDLPVIEWAKNAVKVNALSGF